MHKTTKHEKDSYLCLTELKDSIEYFLENNEINISGLDFFGSRSVIPKNKIAIS